MPLEDDNLDANRRSKSEQIDFDFYESAESSCNEVVGVNKVEIKQNTPDIARELNVFSDVCSTSNIINEYGSTHIHILNSCDSVDGLTKCIAYETNGCDSDSFDTSCRLSLSASPVFDISLSISTESTTSSDLTNVTPLIPSDNLHTENENFTSINVESPKPEMKLLAEAVEILTLKGNPKKQSFIPVSTFNKQTSTFNKQTNTFNKQTSTFNKQTSTTKPKRKNMTFSNDEMRRINRENEILLRKIVSTKKTRANANTFTNIYVPPRTIKAAAAVNRKKQEREINYNNGILSKKIENAKPTQSYFNTKR